MTKFRWALVALAVLAGAGALFHAQQAPDEQPEPLTHATTAASPLNLPASSAVSGVQPGIAQPAANTVAAAPVLVASAPRIGSEGYGAHIEQAQAGNDAAQAWEAVNWLRNCNSNELRRQSAERLRAHGVATEVMTQLMVEADTEARLCQTVTAQHRAMLPELALRAMRAGIPAAATAYASSVDPNLLAPNERQAVGDALRRDALAGEPTNLIGAVLSQPGWGLTDAERLSYFYAYGELLGHAQAEPIMRAMVQTKGIPLKSQPTPEQLVAAETAGRLIVERTRAASSKP